MLALYALLGAEVAVVAQREPLMTTCHGMWVVLVIFPMQMHP